MSSDPKIILQVQTVLQAAMEVDRANLENVEVHPCDLFKVEARREKLYGEARALSDALANLGLLLPSDSYGAGAFSMPDSDQDGA